MKRFYCTICKRVKRVRNYPANVTTPSAYDVAQRVGTCSYHTSKLTSRTITTARNQKVGA